MPNLADRFGDMFNSRTTPQPKETHATVISHSEGLVDLPIGDIDMDETPADQLATEVADAAATTTAPKSSKKAKTPKSKSTTTKTTTSPKARAPAKKPKKATTVTELEWNSATGPDNAVATNEAGEKEWEIARICKVENDGKTLLVQWKGWKGFWAEDYEDIKAQVPKMVKDFEMELKELNKENRRNGKRGRGTSSVVVKRGRVASVGAAAAKSSATATGGVKRGRPAGVKSAAAKPPAATKAVNSGKARGRPTKVTKSPAKATGPKKATAAPKSPAKSPAKKPAAASPKKKAAAKGKANGSGVMATGKRGRPKKA